MSRCWCWRCGPVYSCWLQVVERVSGSLSPPFLTPLSIPQPRWAREGGEGEGADRFHSLCTPNPC